MMLDLKKLFPNSKFPTTEELKAKEDTFSIGDRVKVANNIRCRQHGQIGTITRIEPEDKHGWKSFIVKFDDEKYNSMGFNSGDIDKIDKRKTTMMKKINENQKVTLTLRQLKRLVKEGKDNNQTILYKIKNRIKKVFLDEAKALGIDPEYALLAFDLKVFSRNDRDDYDDPNHDIFFRPAYDDAARYGFTRHIDKALETNEYAYMLAYNRTYKNPYDEETLDWKTAREIIDKHFKKIVRGTYGHGHWVYIVFVDK